MRNKEQRIYIQEVIPNKAAIVVSQLLTLEKLWLLHVTQGKSANISYYINMVESIPVVEFVFAAKTTPLKDILFLSDEIIVRYKEGVRESRIQEIIGWTGAKDLKIKDTENLYRLFLSKKSRYRNPILLANLLAMEYKEITFASPNFYRTVTLFKTPNDPFYAKQWGLKNVQAPGGWDKSTGDDSIKIAVIDDGVDTRHPDLNYSQGYNALTDQMGQKPNSWNCHGTAVSGLASGLGNNAKGLSGIIWRSKIVPIRVFYTKKDGPAKTITSDVIMARGIRKAYQIGSDIFNIGDVVYYIYLECFAPYSIRDGRGSNTQLAGGLRKGETILFNQ
ncbi:MAG: S8 family serine peptidase, partial [Deltaproteobacteria bacterium]|nr:S8 family serine peptidase [Deltaproteobacteria bacterium]